MKAYLYALNTLADWEVSYLAAELNSGRYLSKAKQPIPLIKIGNTTGQIKTMGGFIITPDFCFNDVEFERGDLLILPGGDTWLEPDNSKIIEAAADLLDKGVIIAAICGATIALAQNGILNNRKHTSNNKDFLKMTCPGYTGEKHYINQPAVTDGNLITATGLAPLEFTYEVFKRIDVMKEDTLEAWYQLFKTKEAGYYFSLMESLK